MFFYTKEGDVVEFFYIFWNFLGKNASQIQTLLGLIAILGAYVSINYARTQIKISNSQRAFELRIKMLEYCGRQLQIARDVISNNTQSCKIIDKLKSQVDSKKKENLIDAQTGLLNANEKLEKSIKAIEETYKLFQNEDSISLSSLEAHLRQTVLIDTSIGHSLKMSEVFRKNVEKYQVNS